jgi:hypothetical protein
MFQAGLFKAERLAAGFKQRLRGGRRGQADITAFSFELFLADFAQNPRAPAAPMSSHILVR